MDGITKCQPRLLTPFLDGELDDPIRRQIEDHLRSCPSCGAMLDEVTVASEQVGQMGRASIPRTALKPALEMFVERAGLAEDAHPLTDTVVVARDAGAPVTPTLAETSADDLEAEAPEAAAVEQPEIEGAEPAADGALDDPVAAVIGEPVTEVADAQPEAGVAEEALADEMGSDPDAVLRSADVLHLEPESLPELTPSWIEERADDQPVEELTAEPVDESAATIEPEAMPPAPAPAARPDPRIEPPPEPWATVWQPDPAMVPPEAPPTPAEEPAEEPAALPPPPAALSMETSATGWINAERPLPETEEAVARLRGDLVEGSVPGNDPADDDTPGSVHEYRQALIRESRQRPAGIVLPLIGVQVSPTQLKVGIALALLAVVATGGGAALALSRTPAKSTASTTSKPAVQASSTPRVAAVSPIPSVAPSVAPAPQLTGVVSTGAGGSGYSASRIRTGTPSAGTFRLVFDLDGTGATPTVQLGKGTDGAYYLTGTGISISPAVVQGFAPGGPITGISQVSATGLNLRLAMSSSPDYGMGYLSGPSRLVIDFQ